MNNTYLKGEMHSNDQIFALATPDDAKRVHDKWNNMGAQDVEIEVGEDGKAKKVLVMAPNLHSFLVLDVDPAEKSLPDKPECDNYPETCPEPEAPKQPEAPKTDAPK